MNQNPASSSDSSTPEKAPPLATSPASAPAQTIVIQQNSSRAMRWFAWAGWGLMGGCLLIIVSQQMGMKEYFNTSQGILERYHSLEQKGKEKIAILEISGLISSGEGFVKQQIDRIREDPNVKGVVVRINSPGGTITGSDYLYHHLVALREERDIPIVVSMGGMAASGGYYLAMVVGDQPDSIFAEPTTTTGSIGVIIPHFDFTGLLERYDVIDDSIVSHENKQMLSATRKITDEQREILQNYVYEARDRFLEVIQEGRPRFREEEDALLALATGEIFTGPTAKSHGLVDKIGFIEAAIDRAIELAEVDPDEVRVVQYQRPATLLDSLGAPQLNEPGLSITHLLDLTTPRAYYLATSLPSLISGREGRAE